MPRRKATYTSTRNAFGNGRASRVPKGDTETLDAIRAANERASLSNLYKVQHILCNDECDDDPVLSLQNISYTHNGRCDDGNLNATTDACGAGTDCSDCHCEVCEGEGARGGSKTYVHDWKRWGV